MSFVYPDLDKRMESVKKAVAWAAEIACVFRDQDDGGIVRQANKPWIELRPKMFRTIGTDDIIHQDLETPTTEGTLDWPRQEITVSQKEIDFECRVRSRTQEHKGSGWYSAVKLQTRLKRKYAREKWLKPMMMSVIEVGAVINMPDMKVWDDRVEDLAVLEFTIGTVLCETDETALGSWIDRCLVSSDLSTMAQALQLDDEVMGWALASYVVDESGNFVVDENGNYVIEG